jgi:hypothetical protein
VDGLLFDDDSNNTENEEPIGTEENKIKRLRGVLEKCLNGSDLYNFCIVHLPITGMKFGVLISMNRAIAYLKNTKIVNDKTPTWVNCKKNHKEIILLKFDDFLENSATFKDPTLNGIQIIGGSGINIGLIGSPSILAVKSTEVDVSGNLVVSEVLRNGTIEGFVSKKMAAKKMFMKRCY